MSDKDMVTGNGLMSEVDVASEMRQRDDDQKLLYLIRKIIGHGNDAMVRQRKDGTLVAYEIKMNKISG